jgi:hypothetical protein
VIAIDLTPEERAAGRLLENGLRTAVAALRTDGLVLLNNVVDPAHLEVLHVISVTSAVLGPGVKNVMYGGNTALPGDQRQPVHSDAGHLWPIESLEGAAPARTAGGERAHRRRVTGERGHQDLAGDPSGARRRRRRRRQDHPPTGSSSGGRSRRRSSPRSAAAAY